MTTSSSLVSECPQPRAMPPLQSCGGGSPGENDVAVVQPAGVSNDFDASTGNRRSIGAAEIVELILKDRQRLHRLLRVTQRKADLASRLLGISLASFVLFGVALTLTFDAAALWPTPTPLVDWINRPDAELVTFAETAGSGRFIESWLSGRAIRITLAYGIGLIAAAGVCLPSLYFYGLLAGLPMPMADVVLHSLKGTATSAVALIGILPIYAALALGAAVFPLPAGLVRATLLLGLCLPFIAGLWGTRSLFVGFRSLCDTMPEAFRANRACFLRRLVLSWCACYTAIAPVMIHRLWQGLNH